MNNILDNELVHRYFGNTKEWFAGSPGYLYEMSYCILQAMQQPIRKGELVLERFPSDPINEWQVTKAPKDFDADIHSSWLRLPDAFQKQEPCCKFKKGLWKTRLRPGGIVEICHTCLEEERTQPAPSPEKCGCGRVQWQGHDEKCAIYTPIDVAVEEKINDILWPGINNDVVYDREAMRTKLRDLVKLARETK